MIIYKDILNNGELFTDAFRAIETDEGIFYEVEGKLITEKTDFDDSLIGANKSAEGQEDDEGVEEQGKSGCNIVIKNRLVELPIELKKKEYSKYIKAYIGKLLKKIEKERPGDVATFKTNAQKAVKRILDSFDDWQFFYAEGADFDIGDVDKFDGMLALMAWRPDGSTPYMLFFKDGIEEEKA